MGRQQALHITEQRSRGHGEPGKEQKSPRLGTPGDKGTKKRKLCGLPLLLHSNLNISNESVDKDTTSDRQSQAFRELF
ncbi:hypothetical protein BUN20_22585 [Bacteroides fragilis]|nr:hypothetical protein BUN20_22585 [Bacteroides fragilis]